MKPLKEILQSGRPPGKVQPVATHRLASVFVQVFGRRQ
jgi:fumarate hydratase class II